jgi:predicted enzyme related to lactoylglutathione lyase
MTTLRVCIDVPDLARGVEFYRSTFGFDAVAREGFTELVGAPIPIDILPREPKSRTAENAERTYERHWTPVHVDFVVENVDEVVARAVALGARVESGPIDQPFGRIAQLADPFGHGLCIIQMSERGYD